MSNVANPEGEDKAWRTSWREADPAQSQLSTSAATVVQATPKPLTVGKLAIGVALGILAAVAIILIVRGVAGEVDRANNAAGSISDGFSQIHAAAQLSNDDLELKDQQLEQEIKGLEPNSPCNVLSGSEFTECGNLKGNSLKRKYVQALNIKSGKFHGDATLSAGRLSKASVRRPEASAVEKVPLPLCSDVQKEGSTSYPSCRLN